MPKTVMTAEAARDAFWSRVAVAGPEECWPHSGNPDEGGYIKAWAGGEIGRWTQVHRAAYVFTYGLIPRGQVIHHRCNNPACCNPAHLIPKTKAAHLFEPGHMAALKVARTHCVHGHEYTPQTIYLEGGRRRCRLCRSGQERQRALARRPPGLAPTCQRGHPVTPENTYIGTKRRACRECKRLNARAWRADQKAKAGGPK